MNKKIFRYNTGPYASIAARVLGWIASVWSVLALLDGSVVAWVVLPVGFVTQLLHHTVEFDLEQMTYREGLGLAGAVFGKRKPLPGFDFLFLKKNRYSQTMESRASMATIKLEKFDGYIKLANEVKLHLLQRKNKAHALAALEAIANDLNVPLRDLTDMQYY